MTPFLDSTDLVQDGPELDKRMHRDGYLFVRGLLPKEPLESLRRTFLEICGDAGWVRQDASQEEGVANLDAFCVEPEPRYSVVYDSLYRIQEFHALQHHPDLTGLLQRMTGEAVIPHPRIIARIMFPKRDAFTTKPHQDFVPIQGTADTYTAWLPLSDLPAEMGGLQIAAGSHVNGVYEIAPALGAGGMEIIEDLDSWVGGTFEQGDVLFFHSLAVHRGVPNTEKRLRLSMDCRYQKMSDPMAPGSLEPHNGAGGDAGWEAIYSDWPPGELQYYWNKWDAQIVEYDHSYHDRRDERAFELAAKGNPIAISTLQRVIARHRDPAMRERAQILLDRWRQPRESIEDG